MNAFSQPIFSTRGDSTLLFRITVEQDAKPQHMREAFGQHGFLCESEVLT